MAINNFIDRIKIGNSEGEIAIGSSAYGVCNTLANDDEKTVTIPGFTLNLGTTIHVKFTYVNSQDSPTLNVNNTGAKAIVQYGSTPAGTASSTSGWQAGAVLTLTYDGTSWVRDQGYNTNSTYNVPGVFCNSSATTAAKVSYSDTSSYYVLQEGNIFELTLRYSNTAQSALTLNINSTGAKPIYINGSASSNTNYTLPAGKYLVYYDGTNYQIRTDGKAPISITGSAGSVPLSGVTNATTLQAIEQVQGTIGFLKKTLDNTWTLDNTAYTTNTGTVTSVQVQASTPLQSSTSTAASDTLNTTISFLSQNKNLVLAGPENGNTAQTPTFRALVANDIPSLTKSKISDFDHSHGNISSTGTLTNAKCLVWTDSNQKIFAGNHYADSSKIAINSTTEPSENFYVNGTVQIKLGSDNTSANYRKFVVVGESNEKLSISGSEIQAYSSSNSVDTLSLQSYGGNIIIGNSSYGSATRSLYGAFDFKSSNGFIYSGISTDSDNNSKPIWFGQNNAVGRPVYNNNFKYNPSSGTLSIGTGTITATAYSGNAATATSANIPTTENAIAYYTNTTGTFSYKASANGALFATGTNGTLSWDTLPIAQGGTGKTTANDAANALLSGLPTWAAAPTADTYFIRRDTSGTAAFGQVKFSTIANINNGTVTIGSSSITPVTSVNNHTGSSVTVTASDLGLSNALHFIGKATQVITDGGTEHPTEEDEVYDGIDGDVVIDKDSLREYVWSDGAWIMLGYTSSTVYAQPATDPATNQWISKITQNTDGTISATLGTLSTSGTWSGTATKALTTVETSDTLYLVGVTSSATTTLKHDTSITIQGANITTGTWAATTIDVAHGGTNNTSFTQDCVIVNDSSSSPQLVSRDLKVTVDNNGHLTLTNTQYKNFNITSAGGSLSLVTGAANANPATYSTLILGNASASTAANSSQGKIVLYSNSTNAHSIVGASTSTAYTHTLPNEAGWIVTGVTAGVGDAYTPVYLTADGILAKATTIQKATFSLTVSNSGAVTITNNTSSSSRVIKIVVTSGFSYLKSAIAWEIDSNNYIALSATVDGTVGGYILYIK